VTHFIDSHYSARHYSTRYVYNEGIKASKLVVDVSDKSQVFTQRAEKRPYGVGLLVASYDQSGPHIYETVPSGDYYEYE
jgi:20S proteasome subunit alpha 6